MRTPVSVLLVLLAVGGRASGQYPNAGPDQTLNFPSTAILNGTVQGGTPLDWWTADGNGAGENHLIKYHDASGVTRAGPLRLATGGLFGYPTDFVRVGSTVYGVDGLRRMIYTLDPSTGIVTPIGTAWSAVYADVESLAYDAAGDRLFAVDRTTGQLLRIDRATGALTLVGTRTLSGYPLVHSLAWRASTGQLYAVDQATRAILSIDPSTGASSRLAYLPVDRHGRIEELEFVGDRLYGVKAFDDGASLVAAQLQRIDPNGGSVLDVGPVITETSPLGLLIQSLPEIHVWTKISGPGSAKFADPYALDSAVTFSQPGTYVLQLKVTTNLGPVIDTVTIVENGTPGPLGVHPVAGFASRGKPMGPFGPHQNAYALTNYSGTTLGWSAVPQDNWISLTPSSGQIAPGASILVKASIVDAATGLLHVGHHLSVIQFRDLSNGMVWQTRTADLEVLPNTTAGEWTAFVPSPDTRVVYVSTSSGNDGNDGLSPTKAKRSIWAGKALLRHGYPDWLLLKRGDTWDEPIGSWAKSGRSAREPMLVSSYGSTGPRPLLRTGAGTAIDMFDGTPNDNVAIVGLRFWANLFNGGNGAPRGMQVYGSVHNLLVEDCYFQAYDSNLVVQGTPEGVGRHRNITIRRNVIVDAYTTGGGNTAGLFASSIDGLLVEENVFDHNGWRDDIPGSTPTWFRRNVYIQNGNTGIVFRGNIVAGTDGIQMRPGGLMEDNLFLHNAIAMELGGGTNPEPLGVSGTVRRNVVLDGRDLQPGSPRGWGLWLMNLTSATVESNIFAHNVSGHGPYPITFGTANGWMGNYRGVENTSFWNNIVFAWNGYSRFTGNASQTVNVQFFHNKFQNGITLDPLLVHDQASSTGGVVSGINDFYSLATPGNWMMRAGGWLSLAQWKALVNDPTSLAAGVNFPHPNRTIATYHSMLGGTPTLGAFMTEARKQARGNWRQPYTARAVNEYIRAGFDP